MQQQTTSTPETAEAAPSRRAAQIGLGAAILLLLVCVTLIIGASASAQSNASPNPIVTSNR